MLSLQSVNQPTTYKVNKLMIRIITLIAIALLMVVTAKAQVFNGSFEIASCPTLIAQSPAGWQNVRCDIDLISGCVPSGQADYSNVGTPCNWFGCQQPQNGQNYIAICLGSTQPEVREWVRGEIEPMVKDSVYLVQFYYSRADRYQMACNNMGVYFGTIPYQNPYLIDYSGIDYSKVIYSRETVSDTANWILFSQYYFAKGGETVINLGNFFPDYLTKYVNYGSEFPYAYYYIDNLSVTRVMATDIKEYQVLKPKPIINFNLLGQITK